MVKGEMLCLPALCGKMLDNGPPLGSSRWGWGGVLRSQSQRLVAETHHPGHSAVLSPEGSTLGELLQMGVTCCWLLGISEEISAGAQQTEHGRPGGEAPSSSSTPLLTVRMLGRLAVETGL